MQIPQQTLPTFDVYPFEVPTRWPVVCPEPTEHIFNDKWAVLLLWHDKDICVWCFMN
jgi:hypothetical protein